MHAVTFIVYFLGVEIWPLLLWGGLAENSISELGGFALASPLCMSTFICILRIIIKHFAGQAAG